MNELKEIERNDTSIVIPEISMENRLEIIEDGIRKKYLARLSELQVAPVSDLLPLEEDLIETVD